MLHVHGVVADEEKFFQIFFLGEMENFHQTSPHLMHFSHIHKNPFQLVSLSLSPGAKENGKEKLRKSQLTREREQRENFPSQSEKRVRESERRERERER